jgi:geranylgeranyl pyrophosphate synthase
MGDMVNKQQKGQRSVPSGAGEDVLAASINISSAPQAPKRSVQATRPVQPSIPSDKAARERVRRIAAERVAREKVVPPLSVEELCEQAEWVRQKAGLALACRDFAAIAVNNESWRKTLARIPYERRLLLLPKCLRAAEHCPATIDEFGLLCKGCGLCPIHELTMEAERLGYAVLVADGSAVVMQMIETGRIEAIVGVSCTTVLEKCFPHMTSRAIPGMAIPLLQDGCANTAVDLDWVREVIHLTAGERAHGPNLESVRREVQSWFGAQSLSQIMGPPDGETEMIARGWLAAAGKRWRPYLTTCVYLALSGEKGHGRPPITRDLKKLAVAVECFHKASLIHDDIEDGDDERYGQRTVHAQHGVPVALNAGDFLLGEGYRLIGELDRDARARVDMLRAAANGHLTLSRGQGAELCWAQRPRPLSPTEVLEIQRQKTAPAFEVALRLGAFYGDAEPGVHDVLRQYSEALGVAYQIRDDLEDFTGRGDSNDLRDLRPSIVLALAHERAAGAEARMMVALWNRSRVDDDVAVHVRRIIERRGVIDEAQALLDAQTQRATRCLRVLPNPTLKGLLQRMIGKIFGQDPIEGYCREFEARHASGGEISAEPAA